MIFSTNVSLCAIIEMACANKPSHLVSMLRMPTNMNDYIPMKRCIKCQHELPATTEYFHRKSVYPDGLYPYCKGCRKEKSRDYYQRNAEKIKARARDWAKANPDRDKANHARYAQEHSAEVVERATKWNRENPERRAEIRRAWDREHQAEKVAYHRLRRSANPEIYRERGRRYRERNREHLRLLDRLRRQRNPEKYRSYVRNRRARIRFNGGTHTPADIRAQIVAQTDKRGILHCWWCGDAITDRYHVDHRIPLSRGGSNDVRNLCISHPLCNQSKCAKLPHEWNGRLL